MIKFGKHVPIGFVNFLRINMFQIKEKKWLKQ